MVSKKNVEKMNSVKIFSLISFIFMIFTDIFLVVYIFIICGMISGLLASAGVSMVGGTIIALIIIFFLIYFAVSLFITNRFYKMYKSATTNNAKELNRLNSLLWAIVTLIFFNVISGIFSILAYVEIKDIVNEE